MATSSLEIERKYDVDLDVSLPSLDGVLDGSALAEPELQTLDATYWDTADQRLRAAGMTLRYRSGGTDAGWHLKLPADGDREELQVQGDPGQVPEELAALVRSRARQQDLHPVAQLTTRRTVHRLVGNDGVLAELADDHVVGRLPDSTGELVWREWEIELVGGERALLDAVQERLTAVGARPAAHGSKVAKTLGERATRSAVRPWWAPAPGERVTAGSVVQDHLREQVEELLARDPQVRRDREDAVHKMRVATRRLRSALWTFGPLLDTEATDPVRAELAWLAGVLGAARDVEVMHARLSDLVASQPEDLVLGPVSRRVDLVMTGRYRTAHESVLAELDGARYLQLLDTLEALATEPPFAPEAMGTASALLPRLTRRAWRRLVQSMAAVDQAETAARRDERHGTDSTRTGGSEASAHDLLLHEVRKDAKRARYAAEAVVPVFGTKARRFAASMAQLQEVLGDHQDGLVTREVLREFGALAHLAGENGFTFGRLHALEQAKADAAVAAWPQVRAQASRARLRRFFD